MPNKAHKLTAQHKPKQIHKRDHKHYWPYIPVLMLVITVFAVNLFQPLTRPGVLAYATEMSSTGLLQATNSKRSANNRTALKLNSVLSRAAQSKANDMVHRDYWAHTTPDGKEPWVFISSAGYDYQKAGENLAYGFMTTSATITGWMNSASHRANMLDSNFTEVGFGYANSSDFNDQGKQTIVVAMYAKPRVLASETTKPTSAPTSTQTANTPTKATPSGSSSKVTNKQSATDPAVAAAAFTTINDDQEPASSNVSRLQTIISGNSWLTFAIGILTGLSLAVLLVKHAVGLKHLLKTGEHLVLHHPLLDCIALSIVLIGSVMLQAGGVIR